MPVMVIRVGKVDSYDPMLKALAVCNVANIEPHHSLADVQRHVEECEGCAADLEHIMGLCREYDRFDQMAEDLQKVFKRMEEHDENAGGIGGS